MSIFGMCIVDSYLLLQGCRGTTKNGFDNSKQYFAKLAEELIENTYEQRALRKRTRRADNNGNCVVRVGRDPNTFIQSIKSKDQQ